MKSTLLLFLSLFTASILWAHPDHPHDSHWDDDQQKIQMAIILDASGSMEGLLNQAKSQLWSVVNGLMVEADPYNPPIIEIALIEYGKSVHGYRNRYMKTLVPFTEDLDWLSEELHYLRTGGRHEYAGAALQLAVDRLHWSDHPEDIRLLYIAGNESFGQGPISPERALERAYRRGILVNTVFCGPYQKGVQLGWKKAARMGGGEYLTINHNRPVYYQSRPQDDQLIYLGRQLNQTYIPYGSNGTRHYNRMLEQDRNARQDGNAAQRAMVKASRNYHHENWDLVDAVAHGTVRIEDVPSRDLPQRMQQMSLAQRKSYLEKKQAERKKLRSQIQDLGQKRRKASPKTTKKASPTSQTFEQAVVNSVNKQQKLRQLKGNSQKIRTERSAPASSPNPSTVKAPEKPRTQTGRTRQPLKRTETRLPQPEKVEPKTENKKETDKKVYTRKSRSTLTIKPSVRKR
ncbi:MAG: VWA domain-containing protein [Bacteroidota bacterium]